MNDIILYYTSTTLGYVELVAVITTLICVYLAAKEKVSNFFWGLIGAVLYAYIFFEIGLYAESALNLLYFVPVQVMGIRVWLGGQTENRLFVKRKIESQRGYRTLYCISTVIGLTLTIWGVLTLINPGVIAPILVLDSFIVAMSIVAQYLLSRKILQSWYFWITMDFVATGVYYYKGIYLTSGLYLIFCGLATYGLFCWKKEYKLQ